MASFRGALRSTVQTALQGAGIVPPQQVFTEYDWPVAPANLPAISIATPEWHNEDRSAGLGVPQFWAAISVLIEYRAQDTDRASLISTLDTADDAIESAIAGLIVGPPQLGFRRIVSMSGRLHLDSQGQNHQGGVEIMAVLEYANDAEATITTLLQQVRLVMVRKMKFGGQFGDAFLRTIAGADIDIDQL